MPTDQAGGPLTDFFTKTLGFGAPGRAHFVPAGTAAKREECLANAERAEELAATEAEARRRPRAA